MSKMDPSDKELKYINSCASVDAMDRIASKTFLRMSYEYGVCFLKRELIPALGSVCLKSMISEIGALRDKGDVAVYVNLFDIITFGLVELNFDETEKATNILPDFRLGPKACQMCGMDYNKYIKHQVPISEYKGRVLNIRTESVLDNTCSDLIQQILDTIYSNINFVLDDKRLLLIFLEIFLEEVFYDLGDNKKKNYIYKLYDILYFNYREDDDMWGTDVMPEYKLMVKNDVYSELIIEDEIKKYDKSNEEENKYKGLHYN